MSAPPYMPLYVADYLADTTHLSQAEHGAYLLLLMALWRSGGSLPADDCKLARFSHSQMPQWLRMKATIIALFEIDGDVIWHARLEVERQNYETRHAQKSKAGTASARAKALENKRLAPTAVATKSNESEPEPDKSSGSYEPDADGVVLPFPKIEDVEEAIGEEPTLPDLRKRTWSAAKRILVDQGRMTEAKAGAFFGKLLRDSGFGVEAERLWPALATTELAATQDPQAYLIAAARGIAQRSASNERRIGPDEARGNFAAGLLAAVDNVGRRQAGSGL